jgi:glycosyltransferase involved in cell wall biosynthesis
MERRCEWRFIVLGRSHTRRSAVGPPNLHVWGATTDPMGFYDAIDLILVPSVVEEGFSRMVLEACANGIPVIANRVGGIPEAMGNGGVMIDVDLREELDLEDIADRYIDEIERLFTDEEYYQFMSKNALRRAEEYQEEQKRLSDANYSLYMS